MTWKAPKHAFDSDYLAVLDKAFEATWTAIQAQGPWVPATEGRRNPNRSAPRACSVKRPMASRMFTP